MQVTLNDSLFIIEIIKIDEIIVTANCKSRMIAAKWQIPVGMQQLQCLNHHRLQPQPCTFQQTRIYTSLLGMWLAISKDEAQ